MLVNISSPESLVVFQANIKDIETDGFNIYCAAHQVWGEMNWNTLEVSHNGQTITNMINSSTMTPTIVGEAK